MPEVSVVVVNHNRADLLRRCVESLLGQDFRSLEVIVVDNASSDESLQVVSEIQDQRVRLVKLSCNVGFAAGNNRGISLAEGEFVALLNNDATAHPEWLTAMMAVIRDRPEVGMCACKILFEGTNCIDKAGHLIYRDGQNRGRGTGQTDRGQFEVPCQALFPDGCAALYRKRLLDQLGGFDEDFFAYADDADLGLRARWLGWECLYVPSAVVWHRHSTTLGRFSVRKIYWIERNRLWLAVKDLPTSWLLLSPLFTILRVSWNFAAALSGKGSAGRFRRESSAWTLAAAILKGMWDGLLGVPRMWRKRSVIRKGRRLSDSQYRTLLRRHLISLRELALQERE